jgi:two-component system, chemotaxis family, chemotaxis protein CheV
MSNLLKSVDERTQLAGTNRLEVLLFQLGLDEDTGRDELFGINVFKVREVMHLPEITRAPDMPAGVEGIVSLRGSMVPVINLQKYCKVNTNEAPKILMITEYNKNVQGFLVKSVDTIKRLNWEDVKEPPLMIANRLGGLVTAVTELEDKNLVLILDVEKVLAETAELYDTETIFTGIDKYEEGHKITVVFADDSQIARKQVQDTLKHLGMNYISTNNGAEAWRKLNELAETAESEGRPVSDFVTVVVTDVEMPEMDGYVLTRNIKQDSRLKDTPVIMHSSLSAEANQALGKGVGADAYVPKFKPAELAATLIKVIDGI